MEGGVLRQRDEKSKVQKSIFAMTASPEDDRRRLWQLAGRKEENQEVIEGSGWERTNTHIVGRKSAGL